MIEMQESEYLESDFTDDHLRYVLMTYGPVVKDWLLLPRPVEVQHADRLAAGT
jgi:hypothetical protein